MKDHSTRVWRDFREDLHVERFVSDESTVAVQMWTHFTALHDAGDSLFGPVRQGETSGTASASAPGCPVGRRRTPPV